MSEPAGEVVSPSQAAFNASDDAVRTDSKYKPTDAGPIPDDWEMKPLAALLSRAVLGGNYRNQDRETEYPLIKMGNLARGHIDLDRGAQRRTQRTRKAEMKNRTTLLRLGGNISRSAR